MAQIFNDVFGDNLAKENLVELENLNRLPSPHELQGKIILKGTVKVSSIGVSENIYKYIISNKTAIYSLFHAQTCAACQNDVVR